MAKTSNSQIEEEAKIHKLIKKYDDAEKLAKSARQYPRTEKNKTTVIANHDFAAQESLKEVASDKVKVRYNYVTSKEHCCAKRLEDLEPIQLNEMFVNKIHYGRFLLCRTIKDPYYMAGMLTVVQDSNDELENLSLYNFSDNYLLEPKVLLPKHSILIIKEPYLKSMLNAPDNFHIRVESPTDLIILSEMDYDEKYAKYFLEKWSEAGSSEQNQTFEDLNRKGNAFFVEQSYHLAIRFYTKALNLMKRATKFVQSSDVKKTLNNRAAAYLKLEKYNQAYQDTANSVSIVLQDQSGSNEKAYFRMGKAAYAMRQFETALAAFKECLALNPANKQASGEIARTRARLREAQTGRYDMKSVIDQVFNQKLQRLDLADYFSPDISFQVLNNNDFNNKGMFSIQIKISTKLLSHKKYFFQLYKVS
jgi:tetratricopeptide (TPR) repeat protein